MKTKPITRKKMIRSMRSMDHCRPIALYLIIGIVLVIFALCTLTGCESKDFQMVFTGAESHGEIQQKKEAAKAQEEIRLERALNDALIQQEKTMNWIENIISTIGLAIAGLGVAYGIWRGKPGAAITSLLTGVVIVGIVDLHKNHEWAFWLLPAAAIPIGIWFLWDSYKNNQREKALEYLVPAIDAADKTNAVVKDGVTVRGMLGQNYTVKDAIKPIKKKRQKLESGG